MSELSTAEHYDATTRFGIDHFSDAWGRAVAELGLSITEIEKYNSGPLRVNRLDLVGYHALSYGSDAEVVDEALRDAMDHPVLGKAPINSRLSPDHITDERIPAFLPLGRIVAPESVEIDEGFLDSMDIITEELGRRVLRPLDGRLAFLGRESTDRSTGEDYPPIVTYDHILHTPDPRAPRHQAGQYVAITRHERWSSTFQRIVRV